MPVCGSILWTGLGDFTMPAGVLPKGGVNARIGFPISMEGLGCTAVREGGKSIQIGATK